jgi:hypothetical protein
MRQRKKVPVLGVYMKDCSSSDSPSELGGIKKIKWTWDGIAIFVNGL